MNRSPQLIVIAFHFPPDGSVGGLRWAGISKYLGRHGWQIHVITASPQEGAPQNPGVQVHYCPRAHILNDRYGAWVNRRRAERNGTALPATVSQSSGPTPETGPTLLGRIRESLGATLAFPDYGRGWIWRAGQLARSLQRDHQIDFVVSSGPPHSSHLAAVIACAGARAGHVVDMRDPWIRIRLEGGKQVLDEAPIKRFIITRLEAIVLRGARQIIVNTAEFAERLRAEYPTLPVKHVSNGIDLERLPGPASKFDEFSISYAGALYLGRDLSPIVRALGVFIEKHPSAAHRVKLRVAGSMEASHAASFWREVEALGLHDAVEVRGHVTPNEAVDMTNRSHLALVLAQNQPTQIPAKLYECVGLGLPTLVIAEADGAASREAKRIGAMARSPDDIAGITEDIEAAWESRGRSIELKAAIGYDDIAVRIHELLHSIAAR